MHFNARFRGLLAASLLTAALMGLMISLFSLPVFFLWPVLLGVLAAATVCLMDGTRLSWLPAAAWMTACLLTVLVLLGTVTNGLAQLLDDVLKAWQQLHARNYTSFLAQEDGNTGLTVVLCMLGVLCGLWSIHYVRQPSGLRFWPLAVILAAAAVLFAPMVSVWWLLLAALTVLLLYAAHFGGGKQYSSAALRTWGRLAAVLLVCVTVLGGWNQDAARPAVVDTATNWAAEQVDTLRYGSNAGLPEGNMTKVGPRQISEDTVLEVTMTQPISYYLRGFVGEAYANSRWSTLDSKTLSEAADTFYWLHQDGFYAQSQLTTAAQAGVPDALGYGSTVRGDHRGAYPASRCAGLWYRSHLLRLLYCFRHVHRYRYAALRPLSVRLLQSFPAALCQGVQGDTALYRGGDTGCHHPDLPAADRYIPSQSGKIRGLL